VMRFGTGTEIFGLVHSNYGIHFDGLAHNLVTSAVSSYKDPDYSGGPEFGVYTRVPPVDPLPPAAVPTRTDVFAAGRQFPVPAIDFPGITADLAQMKSDAQSKGLYFASSGSLGYHVVFKTNKTFDLYKITGFVSAPSGCINSQSQAGWGTWSINNQQFLKNYSMPANGIIFFDDDVFVDGQINGSRVTVVAAHLPDSSSTRKNIIIANDLQYTNYDGTDIIGLIAQNNVNIGMVSDDNLRIDGALIAQNGRVGRYYYPSPSMRTASSTASNCSPYDVRSSLTLWGMIATNDRYGFRYTDGNGYAIRNLSYDGNLLYGPPPSFPLTSDQYINLTWQEVK
jgi:hypothetical protein